MNKLKKLLLKDSKETAQRLAKKAIKSGRLLEEEGTFPIYMVVSSHDKNDDIMILHPRYSFEPFKNAEHNSTSDNDAEEDTGKADY